MIVLFIAALTHSTMAPDLPPLIGGRSNIYRHKNASTTHFSTIITPYRSQEPLNINSVTLPKATIPIYEPQVLTLDMTATFDNPFDAKDIEVRLDVTQPSGKTFSLPCYFSYNCTRALNGDKEVITRAGKPQWKVNLSLIEQGTHKLSITAKDRNSTTFSKELTVTGTPPSGNEITSTGFVKVSNLDKKYFTTSEGKSFFPIGSNICWGGDKGTFNFDQWIPEFAKNGANVFRVWLSPHWTTFALELPGKSKDGKGMGQFNIENLYRLDHVVNLARTNGMRIKFCIESYNVLREKDAYNAWEETPQNIANGGVLHTPSEFWESPSMDELYKSKLRYLIGRYAADPTIYAWEFWNEVDLVTGFTTEPVKAWHQQMAKELRAMDPYDHLITTSFSNSAGVKDIDLLNGIDFIQTHSYMNPEVLSQAAVQQSRKGNWGKPHFVGEIGADAGGPRADDDPLGYQIHDPLWLSIAMGASGASQPWWWDSHIAPKNLYSLWKPASQFVNGIEWDKENFRQTQPTFTYVTKPNPPLRQDLSFANGPQEWADSPSNRPQTVKISSAGAKSDFPVTSLLHGKVNHPTWCNPLIFAVDFPTPTKFETVVTGVSGYGGGGLQYELDGSIILNRDFKDSDGNQSGTTLTQYNGVYQVTIPAGKHTFIVRNPGSDWVISTFRFKDLVTKPNPPLIGWGAIGDTTALVWLRSDERNWGKLCVLKEQTSAIPPSIIGIEGLAAGNWKCEVWNTWTGKIETTVINRVGLDGKLRVELPTMEHDYAIKATKK